ncbi:unnamed protein product, partial [Heterotrigona itama]
IFSLNYTSIIYKYRHISHAILNFPDNLRIDIVECQHIEVGSHSTQQSKFLKLTPNGVNFSAKYAGVVNPYTALTSMELDTVYQYLLCLNLDVKY